MNRGQILSMLPVMPMTGEWALSSVSGPPGPAQNLSPSTWCNSRGAEMPVTIPSTKKSHSHPLKKWQSDSLDISTFVYTNHRTLENFDTQQDLLCWQLCWQEFLSQYDFDMLYIPGEDNTVKPMPYPCVATGVPSQVNLTQNLHCTLCGWRPLC